MVVDFILGRGIQGLSRFIEEMILRVKSGAQEMFWNKLMSKKGIDLDLVLWGVTLGCWSRQSKKSQAVTHGESRRSME